MTSLDKSFEDSLFKDGKDLAIDYSELALDTLTDSQDLMKEIPIVKTIVSLYKTGIGIKERFTIKKVTKFLFQLKDLSQEEKQNFITKLDTNKRYKSHIIETVIVLLDRLDDITKAEVIGNLFSAMIRAQITIDDFLKLSSIVDRIYINDLKAFCFRNGMNKYESEIARIIINQSILPYHRGVQKNLASLELLEENIVSRPDRISGENNLSYTFSYETAPMGRMMLEYANPTITANADTI